MKWHGFLVLVMLLVNRLLQAEVVLDGTLGPALALPGPHYQIDAQLGQQHGNNLFHSFQYFNLNNTERATFSGPIGIKNVINRVTGGRSSHIDGLLQSVIPQADVYFINPAGIVFGSQAKLDIQGSFHASTADYLRFQDGGEFNATPTSQSVLTVAEVAAFGFLNSAPASLVIEGSQLETPVGKTLSLIGGPVQIEQQAALVAPSGRINLASIATQGEVTPQEQDLNLSAPAGAITITDKSRMSSSGQLLERGAGGEIYLRAGQANLLNSYIDSKTYIGKGRNIDIQVNHLRIEGGQLTTSLQSVGSGGNINIVATDSVILTGIDPRLAQGSSIVTQVRNKASGDGGTVNIRAKQLQLTDGAVISTATLGAGAGGNIVIKTDQGIFLAGEDQNKQSSGLFAITGYEGDVGSIELEAEQLILQAGTQISTESFGAGQGGDITLRVNGLVSLSGLSSDQFGSLISANASGTGANAGKGGTIRVAAGQLELEEGAQITTSTFGSGSGGQIEVEVAQNTTFSGYDPNEFSSGLFTTSGEEASGDSGTITLNTQQLRLIDNAQINTHSDNQGQAGAIQLHITGEKLVLRDSAITTEAKQADGGDIHIMTPGYLDLANSNITTNVSEEFGNGGNITLQSELMVLNHSQITAQAKQGQGGHIKMTTTGIYNLTQEPLEEIISASSEFGVDGEVTISTPDQNVDEGVVILPTGFSQPIQLLPPCSSQLTQGSRFLFKKLVGSPPSPWDWKSVRLLSGIGR